MDAQLKKGVLDVCVLAALSRRDSYGYQIVKDVSCIIDVTESTLYPLLKRLEGSGALVTYSAEYNGRLRKYYRITPEGQTRIAEFLESWPQMIAAYDFIKGGCNHD